MREGRQATVNEDDIAGTPEYALWLVSGKIAPESGQVSPTHAEAALKLAEQNAGANNSGSGPAMVR